MEVSGDSGVPDDKTTSLLRRVPALHVASGGTWETSCDLLALDIIKWALHLVGGCVLSSRLQRYYLSARYRKAACFPSFSDLPRHRECLNVLVSVLFTDEFRFTLESDSGCLLIWREQRTRYHQANTVERHSYIDAGIMIWAVISLGGHSDLHVFLGATLTGVRYRDEILDPCVQTYFGAIGKDFILMDNNAQPHQVEDIKNYLLRVTPTQNKQVAESSPPELPLDPHKSKEHYIHIHCRNPRALKSHKKALESLPTEGPLPRHMERTEAVTRFRLTSGHDFLGVLPG
ncbi:transposable element Tcb2 transposase [Trichonephila clavipes]|nr:transposable element Tcb2 transposase [Trichonephila clavipes]